MATKKISNINDELDIKLFLFITKKCLIYIILFLGVAALSSFLYLRYTPPIYSTSAVIQISSNEENVSKILETKDVVEGQNDLEKAREFISSGVFLGQVFSKLPLSISYYYEGRILSNEQWHGSAPYEVDATVKNPSIYGIPIYIKFSNKNKYTLSYSVPRATKFEKEYDLNQKAEIPEAELNIKLKDPNNVENNDGILNQNSYYFILNNPDNIVSTYASELTITFLSEEAKTLQITIQDRNADKAHDLVNAIVEEYKTYGVAKKAESANSVLEFIDKQLKVVYDTLFKSELDLDNFKKSYKIDSSISEPLPSIYSRVNDFQNQIVNIELQESLLTEVEQSLKDKDIDIYKLIAIVAGSEFQGSINGFLTSLQDLLIKKEQLLYEVTKNSAQIESINYQIEIQKKLLTESINTLKANLITRKKKLSKFLDDYQGTAFSPKEKYNTFELSRLQRMYSINEQFYNKLIDKKAEYQIARAGYVSEIVVLERGSVPKDPISPRRRLIFFGSILVALFLGFGLILFRYLFFNEITSINDIIKYTDAPVLGIIPKYKKDIPVSQLIVDKKPKSLIAEALRSVRTNLQFISNDTGPKVLAVTSTISGEGKTFIAINLAGIIAFSDKKIIVLDFDLRKPKIHIGFGVENKKGVSTILMGLNEAKDCIRHSIVDNLDFITAGPVPPNPSELMLNRRMTELIEYLKQTYDYILLDCPPVGIVTDGMQPMLIADYPLYIFKASHSKRMFVQNIDRLINESGIKKLAIVLNAVESQYSGYSYGKGAYSSGYGYGYGYAYGYGYGYYDEDHLMPQKKKFFLDKVSDFIMKYIFRQS
jgi:capsular exopolysaccharide synthesis family protein